MGQFSGKTFNIFYLGTDTRFVDRITLALKPLLFDPDLQIKILNGYNDIQIQNLICSINQSRPHLIYIDFSLHGFEYLHLARLLKRMNELNQIPIIGLLDSMVEDSFLDQVNLAGVIFSYFKNDEVVDIASTSILILKPEKFRELPYAKAKLDDTFEAFELARIGYVKADEIHLETFYPAQIGDDLEIESHWNLNHTILSTKAKILRAQDESQYYYFPYNYTIKLQLLDELQQKENETTEHFHTREIEQEERKKEILYKMNNWLRKNYQPEVEKPARAMVIDPQLKLFQQQKRSDHYPFVLRCNLKLLDIEKELRSLSPHLIFINIEAPTPPLEIVDPPLPTEGEKLIQTICETIKNIKDYKPYLVISNSTPEVETFLKSQSYPHFLNSPLALDINFLKNACNILDKKIKMTGGKFKDRVFFKKSDVRSIIGIKHNLNITSINEVFVIIGSDRELRPYSVLKCHFPTQMFITVVPLEEKDNKLKSKRAFTYKCIIHSLSETNKMKLRQFINEVFFRQLNHQKQHDLEEFKKVNENALKNKLNNTG